ncbi:beta-galactoside-binding lectin-like [Sebastes umbrosus]|uniref:beta-galactoside-binding lectin-like n=1 Tax=Sebastes umbrosus TaxID=72105 RepID=UPI00189FFBE2|nr:beta-galactoside-binding lectin-like [Sebastes umbrosus]
MVKGINVNNTSFESGQTLTVVGVPNSDATNFTMNIGPDEKDITMHISSRFGAHGVNNEVVYNSFHNGEWGLERREGGFPFHHGKEFKIVVQFTPTEFLVTLTDGSEIHFPNRMDEKKCTVISLEGDVRITSFQIK